MQLLAFLLLLSWTPPSSFIPLHLVLVGMYGEKKRKKKRQKSPTKHMR